MYVCGGVAFHFFHVFGMFRNLRGTLLILSVAKSLATTPRGVRALFVLILALCFYFFYAGDAFTIISRDDFHLTSLVSRGWIRNLYLTRERFLNPS